MNMAQVNKRCSKLAGDPRIERREMTLRNFVARGAKGF